MVFNASQIKSRDLGDPYKIRASCLATGKPNATQSWKTQTNTNNKIPSFGIKPKSSKEDSIAGKTTSSSNQILIIVSNQIHVMLANQN